MFIAKKIKTGSRRHHFVKKKFPNVKKDIKQSRASSPFVLLLYVRMDICSSFLSFFFSYCSLTCGAVLLSPLLLFDVRLALVC